MNIVRLSAFVSLLLVGAVFGFFYAWICSTMWGLDAADPRVAIRAMQAMNASVRNAVFFPAFFLTPVALALTGILARMQGLQQASLTFLLAAGVYLLGGLVLTMLINVPMNEALGTVDVPEDLAEAEAIWMTYSPRWQMWNIARTIASGAALLMTGWGLMRLNG